MKACDCEATAYCQNYTFAAELLSLDAKINDLSVASFGLCSSNADDNRRQPSQQVVECNGRSPSDSVQLELATKGAGLSQPLETEPNHDGRSAHDGQHIERGVSVPVREKSLPGGFAVIISRAGRASPQEIQGSGNDKSSK